MAKGVELRQSFICSGLDKGNVCPACPKVTNVIKIVISLLCFVRSPA